MDKLRLYLKGMLAWEGQVLEFARSKVFSFYLCIVGNALTLIPTVSQARQIRANQLWNFLPNHAFVRLADFGVRQRSRDLRILGHPGRFPLLLK